MVRSPIQKLADKLFEPEDTKVKYAEKVAYETSVKNAGLMAQLERVKQQRDELYTAAWNALKTLEAMGNGIAPETQKELKIALSTPNQ